MLEILPLAPNRFVFALGLAFVISMLTARLLERIAVRIGLADQPGGRKQHSGIIPITGGIAMYAGFAGAALVSGLVTGPSLALVTALGLLVLVGAADDMHDLTPRAKFSLQLVAALLMTSWASVYVSQLGDLLGFGTINLYNWAIPFSVICALGTINAINMVDGLDGAAGGVSFVAALWLAGAALAQGLGVQSVLLALVAAAIAGFLVWNIRFPGRKQARIFMGDAGSMMLGLALCWFTIDLTQGPGRHMPPIACVWILALPLLDMARVMFVRFLRRESMFDADRQHLHHSLLARGYSPQATTWILIGTSAVLGGIGVGGWRAGVPDWVMFSAFMGMIGAILVRSYARELHRRAASAGNGV